MAASYIAVPDFQRLAIPTHPLADSLVLTFSLNANFGILKSIEVVRYHTRDFPPV